MTLQPLPPLFLKTRAISCSTVSGDIAEIRINGVIDNDPRRISETALSADRMLTQMGRAMIGSEFLLLIRDDHTGFGEGREGSCSTYFESNLKGHYLIQAQYSPTAFANIFTSISTGLELVEVQIPEPDEFENHYLLMNSRFNGAGLGSKHLPNVEFRARVSGQA